MNFRFNMQKGGSSSARSPHSVHLPHSRKSLKADQSRERFPGSLADSTGLNSLVCREEEEGVMRPCCSYTLAITFIRQFYNRIIGRCKHRKQSVCLSSLKTNTSTGSSQCLSSLKHIHVQAQKAVCVSFQI